MRIAVTGATGRVGRHVVALLADDGHDVVRLSRTHGVNVVTGVGLAQALARVECVIDAASGSAAGQARPTPDAALEFFAAAADNLHRIGHAVEVQRMVEVSVIGVDQFTSGHGAAKYAHEQRMLNGPVPVRVLRAAQFHEFVPQLIDWGIDGGIARVPTMRIHSVAARSVARGLVDLATDPEWAARPTRAEPPFPEIAGPDEGDPVEMATRFVTHHRLPLRIHAVTPDDPIYTDGRLLAGPHAARTGPTFEKWLNSATAAPPVRAVDTTGCSSAADSSGRHDTSPANRCPQRPVTCAQRNSRVVLDR
ncbi:MAG: SDR family oxidoreductase [Mycobacteriaceae bacterium]|nr:SDR family oxidoreductase [Mycobacteriaceae bacterium]